MTVNPIENQEAQPTEQKQSDKEYNFAQIRKQLEVERAARQQAEIDKLQLMKEINSRKDVDDDDHDDEPYVDKKRLKKELVKVVKQTSDETEAKIQNAVQNALAQERRNMWMKSNPDFYDVMQHAQKFADKDPELAETILEMPDTFERQKLVYKNIKALGLHQKEQPKTSVQETIDKNRRSPYYQPSGVANAPYAAAGDFSPSGQKNAYEKMKELKSRLRLG